MNNYQDWAQLVAKKLEQESQLLAAIDKDELDDAAATEAFVRAVLKPFLPEKYGIGSGRVVDAYGNYSDYLDVIVFNHDYPRIGMRGTHSAYLYESVLATFAIRAKFVRKSFAEALNTCASLAELETAVDKKALRRLAAKNGLKAGPDNTYVHPDPLRTARFELIGRPLSFVFGFSGFKFSYRQLQENIELWIDNRNNSGISTPMKCLPAVIATQGCFAWRNAAPLALSNREMLGIGNDNAPVRLIVLQLLYLLNRRLQVAIDGYGLKPSLDRYLSHFSVPSFEVGVGSVAEVIHLKQDGGGSGSAQSAASKSAARTRSPAQSVESKPAAESKPPAKPAAEAKPAEPAKPAVETKPAAAAKPTNETRPAAAPKPAADAKPAAESSTAAPTMSRTAAAFKAKSAAAAQKPAPPAAPGSGVFDKPSPFATAPKPEAATKAAPAAEPRRWSTPRAPLGSAPIPQAAPAEKTGKSAPGAKAASAPPPLDITLDGDSLAQSAAEVSDKLASTLVIAPDDEELKPAQAGSSAAAGKDTPQPDFESTMTITPDASALASEKAKKSSDEFIARVKQQLSSSEPIGEDHKDFTSTIPQ